MSILAGRSVAFWPEVLMTIAAPVSRLPGPPAQKSDRKYGGQASKSHEGRLLRPRRHLQE
jgi:hypothetical protein